jgi:hypothetical protein
MLRMTHMSSLLAVLILAGALAPAANASPVGMLVHFHPQQAQDTRITIRVYNKGAIFQDVKVAGKIYTVLPHERLVIKAEPGTEVYSESTGFGHRKGELLFAVKPEMKDTTISIN